MVIFGLTLLLGSFGSNAFELSLLDQDGNKIKDAYIAIPEGQIETNHPSPKIMDQIDQQFVPHVLAVAQGDSVVFPNSDNIRHHVYSFSKAKRFEIELYEGVPDQPILFDQAGLVVLGCNIHDSMLGYILVSPWPEFSVSDKTGKVSLSKPVQKVAVWHPWLKDIKEPIFVDVSLSENKQSGTIQLNLTKPKAPKKFKNFRKRYDD